MAKEVGVKVAFGTDILFAPVLAERQGAFLAKLQRWYTPYEVLKMATSTNAELFELAGPRHPYQQVISVDGADFLRKVHNDSPIPCRSTIWSDELCATLKITIVQTTISRQHDSLNTGLATCKKSFGQRNTVSVSRN